MRRGSDASDIFSTGMRRFVFAIVLLSVVTVVATLLWGAQMVTPRAGPTDSYGAGPLGHRVFAETLEALGMHVMQSRGDRYEGPTAPVLFIEPAKEARIEGHLRKLEDALVARTDLPTVVVLPKWTFHVGIATGRASPVAPADVQTIAGIALDDPAILIGRRRDSVSRHSLAGILGDFDIDVPELQTVQSVPADATVLLDAAEGAVVLRGGDGTLLVSDPDLLHSFNMHKAQHAAV